MLIATRGLVVNGQQRWRGDFVPEAAHWTTLSAYLSLGQIIDVPDAEAAKRAAVLRHPRQEITVTHRNVDEAQPEPTSLPQPESPEARRERERETKQETKDSRKLREEISDEAKARTPGLEPEHPVKEESGPRLAQAQEPEPFRPVPGTEPHTDKRR